jgi:glycosyltransferase involved in cell wall biosynthesis
MMAAVAHGRIARVYRRIPRLFRTHLGPLALPHQRGIESTMPTPIDTGVTIAGLFSSSSEMGEGARLCADALEADGVPVVRFDLGPLLGMSVTSLQSPWQYPLRDGPLIVHLKPPLFRKGLHLLGRSPLRHRPVIAYWAWELERVPADWCRAAHGATEIWTPSCFAASALRHSVRVPVLVVPHPVPRASARSARAILGWPAATCVFLNFLNVHSNLARKNPEATIAAYARAFPLPRTDVLLVLKLDGVATDPAAIPRLAAQIAACACPVRLMTDALDKATHDTLIASADVIVSLHRSEGFGLMLAEGMVAGRTVVATGWSGNLEFMSPDKAVLISANLSPVADPQGFYDPSLRWADPDVDEAARWMEVLAENHFLRAQLGAAARQLDLLDRFRASITRSSIGHFLQSGRP